MSNRNIEAVLFDLDGVLIDSEGAYTDYWVQIDRIYPTHIDNFPLVIKGTTLPDILNRYFAAELHADIIERGREYESQMKFPLFEGASEVILKVKHAGIPMAVVTSSMNDKMMRLKSFYPDFFELFNLILTGNDVKKSKPNPEGYITAARRIGVDPAHCIVVEDSVQGMQAGHSAGAFVVGICHTVGYEATEREADVVINGIDEFDIDTLIINKEKSR